jgi:hypothetical protein
MVSRDGIQSNQNGVLVSFLVYLGRLSQVILPDFLQNKGQ